MCRKTLAFVKQWRRYYYYTKIQCYGIEFWIWMKTAFWKQPNCVGNKMGRNTKCQRWSIQSSDNFKKKKKPYQISTMFLEPAFSVLRNCCFKNCHSFSLNQSPNYDRPIVQSVPFELGLQRVNSSWFEQFWSRWNIHLVHFKCLRCIQTHKHTQARVCIHLSVYAHMQVTMRMHAAKVKINTPTTMSTTAIITTTKTEECIRSRAK